MISLDSLLKLILISNLFIFVPAAIIGVSNPLSAKTRSRASLTNLRAEYKTNPIGIDVLHPRLSWEIVSDERGVKQTAYEVRAADAIENLQSEKNLIWDTGKVPSDQSIHVEYQGEALTSGQHVYWQARIWDEKDQPTDWSEIGFWEMGLLKTSDWKAAWITPDIKQDITTSQPCPFLRKEFRLTKNVQSARAYVTSLGLYELHINGQKVGDQVFTPGWTSYFKRLQYQTYDVTDLLANGKNEVGSILGDGWYRGFWSWNMTRNYYGEKLALLLQIQVNYQDGTSEVIGTDSTWKAATGPILESDIYNGEIYDARLEMNNWDKAGFDDQNWHPVKPINHSKKILVAPLGPPVRKIQEIKPIDIIRTPNGETVFDMGQNMVGWIRLRVKGKSGTTITLQHAEVLDKHGNLYTENLRKA
ncbi:MAG: family 78 glycoside hydrolase catalytic domain, partial [bacterium]|nr:family 78 glycoside hydrolase catalytic domain [bacterium]